MEVLFFLKRNPLISIKEMREEEKNINQSLHIPERIRPKNCSLAISRLNNAE